LLLPSGALPEFAPSRLPATIAALAEAQDDHQDTAIRVRAIEARRVIADCDQRLARYRAALEAGTDPKQNDRRGKAFGDHI
jgi:hypothetical protein